MFLKARETIANAIILWSIGLTPWDNVYNLFKRIVKGIQRFSSYSLLDEL